MKWKYSNVDIYKAFVHFSFSPTITLLLAFSVSIVISLFDYRVCYCHFCLFCCSYAHFIQWAALTFKKPANCIVLLHTYIHVLHTHVHTHHQFKWTRIQMLKASNIFLMNEMRRGFNKFENSRTHTHTQLLRQFY